MGAAPPDKTITSWPKPVNQTKRGAKLNSSSSSRQRRRKAHRIRDEEGHCRRMLLNRETANIERMMRNGHFYQQKTGSQNCLLQNGVLGKAALLEGGTLPGEAIEGLRKAIREEREGAARLEGMETLAVPKKTEVDWLRTVTFYWASPDWTPATPKIDEGKGVKRQVKHHVVEDLLRSGEFKIADGKSGVVMPGHFIKMPISESERDNPGLYEVLQQTATEVRSSGRHRCRDRSGQRTRALDGENSFYLNVGPTVRYGKGHNESEHASVEALRKDSAFLAWVKKVERKTRDHLPKMVEGTLKAVANRKVKPTLGGDLWQSVAFGRNVYLNEHKDKDNTWSLLTVVAEKHHNEIICYFMFPEVKIAVPMRDGDMLGFNPLNVHCVSSRRDPEKDAFCISLYSTAKAAEANDRNVKVAAVTAKVGRWVDLMRSEQARTVSAHRKASKKAQSQQTGRG